ncbi:hypothetical protein M441DRAFT_48220 [Trichoderma asperellum CBS 433.97]|uniref:Uncharacterized protein n=1 Tax=Trichoderma asperellum (strain ATCC 204424 / CBS 433.97 / NBRC 101777) TaxID=1042311 RepID=A0A2T3Z6C7_TRIA4|nr:hypothetical protein M441DRAFT_48220 [Trichoderma asperellum CBS 433.97]PTB40376.1 hypothetical protein M441DRAFT_48220 [Trichoderma asperellum CBS 433.97]
MSKYRRGRADAIANRLRIGQQKYEEKMKALRENDAQINEILRQIWYNLGKLERDLSVDHQDQHLPSNHKGASRMLAAPESRSESTEPRFKANSNDNPKPEGCSYVSRSLDTRDSRSLEVIEDPTIDCLDLGSTGDATLLQSCKPMKKIGSRRCSIFSGAERRVLKKPYRKTEYSEEDDRSYKFPCTDQVGTRNAILKLSIRRLETYSNQEGFGENFR